MTNVIKIDDETGLWIESVYMPPTPNGLVTASAWGLP